ncbi:TadE/TadG family type IV pilus assembly protein [Gracilibacillus alcaliphilus]|uniref:TadE/TadG family type IV pilus assembly protein n=1 Tax=Gracilibacillus alcaliphilus TaxID=1401441 RepID=UPI00195A9FCD|nr:TadE family protein [Gracilibacillus alcaliphilus]MBM7676557.1 hypothetical protein [Gracilibacillus alcaliphilus]
MEFIKRDNGSITLEAALIIPILLTFILFLTSLVKISVAEMALQEAVNETAQSVSHYSYLAMLAQGQIKKQTDGFVDSLTDQASNKLGNNEVADYVLQKLGSIGKDVIPTSGDALNHFSDSMYQKIVQEKYRNSVFSSGFFSPDNVRVTNSSFPHGTSGEAANVKIEAENTMQMVLPFFEKEIKIKKVAVERGWVGTG